MTTCVSRTSTLCVLACLGLASAVPVAAQRSPAGISSTSHTSVASAPAVPLNPDTRTLTGGPGTAVNEVEPNNNLNTAQRLSGGSPITVTGQTSNTDVGQTTIDFSDGTSDDLEDLFVVTTTGTGLTITLGGYTEDLDLYLIDGGFTAILGQSAGSGPTETISQPTLPAGTYLIGVTFYDAGSETGQTPYTLTVAGQFATAGEADASDAKLVLHTARPNPVSRQAEVAFETAEPGDVLVAVYDVLGREVARLADGPHAAGPHSVSLDAAGLSGGLYIVRLVAGTSVRTRTLVVAR